MLLRVWYDFTSEIDLGSTDFFAVLLIAVE